MLTALVLYHLYTLVMASPPFPMDFINASYISYSAPSTDLPSNPPNTPITTTQPLYPPAGLNGPPFLPPSFTTSPRSYPPGYPSPTTSALPNPPGYPSPTTTAPYTPTYGDLSMAVLPEGCYFTDQMIRLTCHGAHEFPVVDKESALKVEEIHVKDCGTDLVSLNNSHLSIYSKLESIWVNNCGLKEIAETTFIYNKHLKNLDVANNLFTMIQYQAIIIIQKAQSISLMDNPFVCNCSMMWISVINALDVIKGEPYCNGSVPLKTLNLTHCEAPNAIVYQQSKHTGLSIGDNVTLSCSATGTPPLQVFWISDNPNRHFSEPNENSTDVTVHITNLTREDNGNVTCYAKNAVFRDTEKVEIQINVGMKVDGLYYHDSGNCLHFIVSGTPPYNISWERYGEPIPSGFWEDILCGDPDECVIYKYGKQTGCMRWKTGQSGGTYRISVSNAFGSDNRSVDIGLHSGISNPFPDFDPSVKYETKTNKTNTISVTKEEPSDKTSVHVIAPVIAVISVIAILLMGVFCKQKLGKFKKSKRVTLDMEGSGQEMARLTQFPDMLENPHYHLLSKHYSQKLRVINVKELIFIKELGEGAFGRVFLGSCINLFTGDERTMVAIKTLKTSVTEEALRDFEHEAELMAEVSHDNIVSFYGISYNGESLMMIFEYMENKDLNNYLRSNGPDATSLGFPAWNSNTLFIYDLLYVAKQISAAMSYLAKRHFVHRDLATRNCLVGEKLIVKIGDFGMSRDIYSTDYYKVGGQTMLPIRWMPPESVLYRKFTIESDVWSFGVVLWEIFSYGRQPWFELSNMEVIEYIKDGKLLKKPDECTDELYELMLGCWHAQPTQRMTMCEIHDLLCNYLAPDSPYNNNSRTLENRECQQCTILDV